MLYRTYRVSVLTLAAAALAAILTPVAAVQAATLLGLYEFEGNFNDTSGNAANGFGNTGVTFNGAGFQGQAGQFNGGSSFDVPVNIDVTTRPKATIGAWVNADVINGTARHEIVSSDNSNYDRTLTIDSRDTGGGEAGVARYSSFNGSGALLGGTTASIADGYVFVAASYNQPAASTNLYVGGSKFTEAGTFDGSQTFLRVGAHAGGAGEFFNGQIDNLFVFDGALSDGQISRIRTGGVSGIQRVSAANQLWSVDIHGSGAPALKSGVETNYGFGNVWNGFTVAHHAGTSVNPTSPLVDSNGAASSVNFSITGTVSGFNNGGDPLVADYLFINAGNASPNITWTISGLVPGGLYEMYNYAGAIGGRDFNMAVDSNGNGLLADEASQNIAGGGRLFGDIIASSTGTIIGNATNAGHEGNWAGFQLRSLAVPEPSSIVLAGLGAAAMLLLRYRRS